MHSNTQSSPFHGFSKLTDVKNIHTPKGINTIYELCLSVHLHISNSFSNSPLFLIHTHIHTNDGLLGSGWHKAYLCEHHCLLCVLADPYPSHLGVSVLWVKGSQLPRGMLMEALRQLQNPPCPLPALHAFCLIPLTSSAKSLAWTSMLRAGKTRRKRARRRARPILSGP